MKFGWARKKNQPWHLTVGPPVHRQCPADSACGGYDTPSNKAVGSLIRHLRDKHPDFYLRIKTHIVNGPGPDIERST